MGLRPVTSDAVIAAMFTEWLPKGAIAIEARPVVSRQEVTGGS